MSDERGRRTQTTRRLPRLSNGLVADFVIGQFQLSSAKSCSTPPPVDECRTPFHLLLFASMSFPKGEPKTFCKRCRRKNRRCRKSTAGRVSKAIEGIRIPHLQSSCIYSIPSTRSIAQHPLAWGPELRQCSKSTWSVQPASTNNFASVGKLWKSRLS